MKLKDLLFEDVNHKKVAKELRSKLLKGPLKGYKIKNYSDARATILAITGDHEWEIHVADDGEFTVTTGGGDYEIAHVSGGFSVDDMIKRFAKKSDYVLYDK